VSFPIPASASRFVVHAGIDDEVGSDGSAVFRILVDEEERWSSGLLTGETAAKSADVPVKGGRKLMLIVDYGPNGDVQDVTDWCEPVFLK
jgi:hypothetical protein